MVGGMRGRGMCVAGGACVMVGGTCVARGDAW